MEKKITIIASSTSKSKATRGRIKGISEIDEKTFQKEFQSAIKIFSNALTTAPVVGGFPLNSITIGLGIYAQGGGVFFTIGGNASINLTFQK